MKPLSKREKIDIAILSQSLNGAATSRYHDMSMYRTGAVIWHTGAMAAGVTSAAQIMQAKDAAGTDAKSVVGKLATITANNKVTGMTITCANVIATNKVTVNGIEFEAAATEDLANRKFAVGANDTACAASLVKAINHATAGVPGVTATSALGVVTLAIDVPGELTLTASSPDATITVATTSAIGAVEFEAADLDVDGGFTHVAVTITNSAASQTAAFLVRADGRFEPEQQMASA